MPTRSLHNAWCSLVVCYLFLYQVFTVEAVEAASAGATNNRWGDADQLPQLPKRQLLEPSGASLAAPRMNYTEPGYVEDGHNYMLSLKQRLRGVTYVGSNERLRRVLHRALAEKRLTVSLVGGSISAGLGAEDSVPFLKRFTYWLQHWFGSQHGVEVNAVNAAVEGTTSHFMAACLHVNMPRDADIVFVEYSVNDPDRVDPPFNNPVRRPFERLLRKLLQLERRPAVVLLHAYRWYNHDYYNGAFWHNSERDLNEFGLYYGLPALSVKACCYHDMRENRPGFMVSSLREKDPAGLLGKAYFYDPVHPDGHTGHRVHADLMVHLVQTTLAELGRRAYDEDDAAVAELVLPPPMIRGNWEAGGVRCLLGPQFKDEAVVGGEGDGWQWTNEGRRRKWGMLSTTVGSSLRVKVDSRAADEGQEALPVLVQLAHLKSYEHMGIATIICESGCQCPESQMDSHHEDRTSVTMLYNFFVSQAEECVLRITVSKDSSSPGLEHKVKVMGIIVSEHASNHVPIGNAAAVELVHQGSSAGLDR